MWSEQSCDCDFALHPGEVEHLLAIVPLTDANFLVFVRMIDVRLEFVEFRTESPVVFRIDAECHSFLQLICFAEIDHHSLRGAVDGRDQSIGLLESLSRQYVVFVFQDVDAEFELGEIVRQFFHSLLIGLFLLREFADQLVAVRFEAINFRLLGSHLLIFGGNKIAQIGLGLFLGLAMRINLSVQTGALIVQVLLQSSDLSGLGADVVRRGHDRFTHFLQRLLVSRFFQISAELGHVRLRGPDHRCGVVGVGRIQDDFKAFVTRLIFESLNIVVQLFDGLYLATSFAFQLSDLRRAVGILAMEHVRRDAQDDRQHHENDQCVVNGTRLVRGGGHGKFLPTARRDGRTGNMPEGRTGVRGGGNRNRPVHRTDLLSRRSQCKTPRS